MLKNIKSVSALIEKANCLYELGKYYDSVDVFEEVLELDKEGRIVTKEKVRKLSKIIRRN